MGEMEDVLEGVGDVEWFVDSESLKRGNCAHTYVGVYSISILHFSAACIKFSTYITH